ncbi:MAG: hypothetical protein E7487_03050 [Ruminococcaceae bacterium]|nr:hypothetical protein [Oscillospiraceae bacterium]
MKKIFFSLVSFCLLITLVLPLSGCSNTCSLPADPPQNRESYIGEIAQLWESTALICGCDETASSGELYTVALSSPKLVGADGKAITQEDLKPGMKVQIFYTGGIQETWPAGFTSVEKIAVMEEGTDLLSMYSDVLKEIYICSEGLNKDINLIALDLTKTINLTDAQKSALSYMAWNEFDLDTVLSTSEQLCKQGLINEDELFFENGILIEISTEETPGKKSFTFSVSKWRSGLGAVFFEDCSAKYRSGHWQYTLGGAAIS